ncbi:ABC transporter permease subunit [Paractinoplanes lichenicola]|uniref:ABC transporter permease subunit n=1 Tax=Paractinoplanes lichenicola TaxID=2802976 RepID=A0ABS1VFJ5_9ACTN|nr:ABC transporter permease subunit [Actinoplanes lichenicola]MBL7253266.1 ABC transporter permease subunit [Actinoplanes lichenicola]
MTWLALRLLRPYLLVAALLTAGSAAVTLHGVSIVRRQLADADLADCLDPNVCYPHGAAVGAVFRMELVAAFVPPLLGLIIGVALFAREREDDTLAFALTQSITRRRWVTVKFGWALAAGLTCSAVVALLHRLVATRYTVLANDTYEMLQLLHLNNAAFMVAQTALLIALGGVIGLSTGHTLRTLVLTAAGGPFAILFAAGVAAGPSYFMPPPTGDLYLLDPIAYLTSAVAAAAVAGLVLLAPRIGTR